MSAGSWDETGGVIAAGGGVQYAGDGNISLVIRLSTPFFPPLGPRTSPRGVASPSLLPNWGLLGALKLLGSIGLAGGSGPTSSARAATWAPSLSPSIGPKRAGPASAISGLRPLPVFALVSADSPSTPRPAPAGTTAHSPQCRAAPVSSHLPGSWGEQRWTPSAPSPYQGPERRSLRAPGRRPPSKSLSRKFPPLARAPLRALPASLSPLPDHSHRRSSLRWHLLDSERLLSPPFTVAEGEARTPARRIASTFSFGGSSMRFAPWWAAGVAFRACGKGPSLIPGSVAEGRLRTAAVRPPFHCWDARCSCPCPLAGIQLTLGTWSRQSVTSRTARRTVLLWKEKGKKLQSVRTRAPPVPHHVPKRTIHTQRKTTWSKTATSQISSPSHRTRTTPPSAQVLYAAVYRFTGIQKRVLRWWKRPFWFSWKISFIFSLNWLPYQGGCSHVLISSKKFDSSICDWKNQFSFFFGKYHLFRIESFRVDFRCVHRLQLLKVCNQYVTLPISPRVQCVSEENSR